MSQIDDERLRFYFEHERQIHEWAALERGARRFLNDLLDDMPSRFEQLSQDLGEDVRVCVNVEGNDWPEILLYRPGWLLADSSWHPRAAIGLAWGRRQVTIAAKERPYTGLKVSPSKAHADLLQSQVALALKQSSVPKDYQSRKGWPAWRYAAVPQADYWNSLDTYRDGLMEAIRVDWNCFADLTDRCVRQLVETVEGASPADA